MAIEPGVSSASADVEVPDPRAALFVPIRSRNVFEEALERVAHAVKVGVYRPGERLPSERELAARLGISRPTVREVTRALEQAGYVTLRRGRMGGAYVLERDHRATGESAERVAEAMGETLRDALDLRWAVEPATADLAARRAGDDDVRELRRHHQRCVEAKDREYRPRDMMFHLQIARMARSPSLESAVRDIQMRLTDMFTATPVINDVLRNSDRQHATIVEAIGRGDASAAREAMEDHLTASHAFLNAFLSKT